MRKVLFAVGAVLLAFSVYTFVVVLFAQQGLKTFEPIVCPAGSTIDTSSFDYSLPNGESGTNINVFCVDAAGTRTDVVGTFVLLMAVPWVVGLIMVIYAGNMGRKKALLARMDAQYGIGTGAVGQANLDALVSEAEQLRQMAHTARQSAGVVPEEKSLKGLQLALDSGRITQAQFDQARAALGQFYQADGAAGGPLILDASPAPGGDDLAQKLESLQKALDSGLITQEEFDRKHKEIVDKF